MREIEFINLVPLKIRPLTSDLLNPDLRKALNYYRIGVFNYRDLMDKLELLLGYKVVNSRILMEKIDEESIRNKGFTDYQYWGYMQFFSIVNDSQVPDGVLYHLEEAVETFAFSNFFIFTNTANKKFILTGSTSGFGKNLCHIADWKFIIK